jgi:predicted outer membrane repeat protein
MRNGLTMKWGLSGNGDHVLFFSDNGAAAVQGGGINTTGSTTAFNTTSDARLKTNLRQIANSGSIIDAIRPVLHDWKTGETDSYGFLAQELIEVFPRAVTAGDNDSEVSKPWGVDMSKLIPVLVAEIKSMRGRVAALESN